MGQLKLYRCLIPEWHYIYGDGLQVQGLQHGIHEERTMGGIINDRDSLVLRSFICPRI